MLGFDAACHFKDNAGPSIIIARSMGSGQNHLGSTAGVQCRRQARHCEAMENLTDYVIVALLLAALTGVSWLLRARNVNVACSRELVRWSDWSKQFCNVGAG
jgi:hypothetical protein